MTNRWVVQDLSVVDLDQYNNNLYKIIKRQIDPYGKAMKK